MTRSKKVCHGCNHPEHTGATPPNAGHPDYDPAKPDAALWWWLSFADGDKPRGSQFLGCAVVDGRTMADAMARAWRIGCNPGGEVLATPFPADAALGLESDDKYRLLTADESRALDDRIMAATIQ